MKKGQYNGEKHRHGSEKGNSRVTAERHLFEHEPISSTISGLLKKAGFPSDKPKPAAVYSGGPNDDELNVDKGDGPILSKLAADEIKGPADENEHQDENLDVVGGVGVACKYQQGDKHGGEEDHVRSIQVYDVLFVEKPAELCGEPLEIDSESNSESVQVGVALKAALASGCIPRRSGVLDVVLTEARNKRSSGSGNKGQKERKS